MISVMRRVILLIAAILLASVGRSQTINIEFKNGSTQKYNMNDIEAITFSQDDNSSQEQGTIEGDFVKVTFEGNTYQEPMPFYCQVDPVGWNGDTPLTFTYDAIEHFKNNGFAFMLGLIHYSRQRDLLNSSPGTYKCVGNIYLDNYSNFTFTGMLEIDYKEYDFVSGTHQVTSVKEVGGKIQIEGNFTNIFEYHGDTKTIKGNYRMTIPD